MALVITIIVMLILAGVTISIIVNGGIFQQAQKAVEQTKKAQEQEKEEIIRAEIAMEFAGKNPTYSEMKDYLTGKGYQEQTPGVFKNINNDEMYVIKDGTYNGEVNTPKLLTGMTAIYWDENNKELKEGDKKFDWSKWYDYNAKQWANAKTDDGSYWVWIPRYSYKVTSGYNGAGISEGEAGTIDIKFLKNTSLECTDGDETVINTDLYDINGTNTSNAYFLHPAFGTDLEQGGWTSQLSGFWIAKFDASRSDATIDSVGLSTIPTSVPNVTSWESKGISDCYANSYNYNRNLGSHLMKNSEWGATTYLTHSKYGRSGIEVSVNQCSNFITGAGASVPNEVFGLSTYSYNVSTFESTYAWNTARGFLASSTGNIYGVYDMSGGRNNNVSATLRGASTGGSLTDEASRMGGDSTEYVTVYQGLLTETADYNKAMNANKYGDALYETARVVR